jgi:hypothetical protein
VGGKTNNNLILAQSHSLTHNFVRFPWFPLIIWYLSVSYRSPLDEWSLSDGDQPCQGYWRWVRNVENIYFKNLHFEEVAYNLIWWENTLVAILLRFFGFLAPKDFNLIRLSNLLTLGVLVCTKIDIYVCIP